MNGKVQITQLEACITKIELADDVEQIDVTFQEHNVQHIKVIMQGKNDHELR